MPYSQLSSLDVRNAIGTPESVKEMELTRQHSEERRIGGRGGRGGYPQASVE
jgi:hypothetical protein